MLRVQVERSKLDINVITELQAQRHLLAYAGRAYVSWLRERYEALVAALPAAVAALRAEYAKDGRHLRIPEVAAHTEIALKTYFAFAVDCGVLTPAAAKEHIDQVRTALGTLSEKNAVDAATTDPVEIFLDALRAGLATNRIRLCSKGQALEIQTVTAEPIGWRVEPYAMVLPDLAYRVACQLMQQTGRSMPTRLALAKMLAARGVLVPPEREARLEYQLKVGRTRYRTWRLRLERLEAGDGPADEEHSLEAVYVEFLQSDSSKQRRVARG
jgi:hypothetical protein